MERHRKLSTKESEPALVRGVVLAVLGLLATLGVSWAANVDKETLGAIVGFVVVVMPLVQGLWTRFAVTSNKKVVLQVTGEGAVVAGDAATAPTGAAVPLEHTVAGAELAGPVRVDPTLVA